MTTRVLLIEDQIDVARTLRRALAIRGYSLSVVRSCGEARALCRSLKKPASSVNQELGPPVQEKAFDCAVVDIDLPDGSGIDLAEQLLGSCLAGVVFVSGTGDVQSIARASEVGPLVRKSQGFEQLLRELAHVVEKPDAQLAPPDSTQSERRPLEGRSAPPDSVVTASGRGDKSGEHPIDGRARDASKTRLSGKKA